MTDILLTTERLRIRPPTLDDAAALNAAVVASLPELRPFMPWATPDPDVAATRAFITHAIAQNAADLEYHLLLTTPAGDIVGSSGVHHVDWRIPQAETSYWIATPWTRRGFAREATAALTALLLGDMGMRRVQILASERNTRSWRIPQALGFTHEGTLRWSRVDSDGVAGHTCVYARCQDHPTPSEPWAAIHRKARGLPP